MEMLKGKDVIKFITDNNLMENQIFIYRGEDSSGFLVSRVEEDEDGDAAIFAIKLQ